MGLNIPMWLSIGKRTEKIQSPILISAQPDHPQVIGGHLVGWQILPLQARFITFLSVSALRFRTENENLITSATSKVL